MDQGLRVTGATCKWVAEKEKNGGGKLARLTRHEILKEDKFLTTLEVARDFLTEKRKVILIVLGIVVAALVLVFGTQYYLAQKDEVAKDELSQALKIYHSSVGAQPANGQGTEIVYSTSAEKFEKAAAAFHKVADSYSSRSAGKIARYYEGLSFRELGKTKEAIAALSPLSSEKSDYGALALRALASIHEAAGDLGRATEVYQQIVQNESALAPKSEVLMHLAGLYEQQKKSTEAAKVYQQVIKDFPGTAYATEAEQKLKQLSH